MDKNELFRVLNDWNAWSQDLPIGIKREQYLAKARNLLDQGSVIVITGARRSGKSYLMRQIADELVCRGIRKNQILIANFEDPRFVALSVSLLEQIFEVFMERMRPEGRLFVFLDEIQEVAQWEKWVRMRHELDSATLTVTGSNARLLSAELGTLLTGRHIDMVVLPLSFREFLAFKGVSHDGTLAQKDYGPLLYEYSEYGAFPKVAMEREKQKLLLTYFDDILTKDLIRRYRIRKPEHLKSLAKFYLSNSGSLITFARTGRSIGLSADTVEKFSGYFESAYLLFFLKRFSYKVREQEKSPRKVYAIDSGIANSVGFRFSGNRGRIAETIVFIELKRRLSNRIGAELYYWKDPYHREVDFLVKDGPDVTELIQVCWNINDEQTKKRERSSLTKALAEFKLTRGLIITEEQEGEEVHDGLTIQYIPLQRWLLADPYTTA